MDQKKGSKSGNLNQFRVDDMIRAKIIVEKEAQIIEAYDIFKNVEFIEIVRL